MIETMATVTKAKIDRLARALLPRHGIRDVSSIISTAVKHRDRDGHVKIEIPGGGWSWYAAPASTVVTPSRVILSFPADHRRDAAQARADLHHQLENAALSMMSEDEMEARIRASQAGATGVTGEKSKRQIGAEIVEALAEPREIDVRRAQDRMTIYRNADVDKLRKIADLLSREGFSCWTTIPEQWGETPYVTTNATNHDVMRAWRKA